MFVNDISNVGDIWQLSGVASDISRLRRR